MATPPAPQEKSGLTRHAGGVGIDEVLRGARITSHRTTHQDIDTLVGVLQEART